VVLDGVEVALICPGCMTDAERQEIEEDWAAAEAVFSRCSRCDVKAPERGSEPLTDRGWIIVDEGAVCPT
jgi:hypothetical protein